MTRRRDPRNVGVHNHGENVDHSGIPGVTASYASNDVNSNITASGLNPMSDRIGHDRSLADTANPNNPFSRSASEIQSVQDAKHIKPFQTIDVNPFVIRQVDAPVLVPVQTLADITGIEYGTTSPAGNEESSPQPFWRTIKISVPGNSLRFEFLPTRIVDADVKGFESNIAQVPQFSDQTNTPFTLASNPLSPFYARYGIDTSWGAKRSADFPVLIQFEETTSACLMVRDGDVFDLPFNTVYLTFKTRTQRFRITIGNNARIARESDTNVPNGISYFPGRGLWRDPIRHPVPFCISEQDLLSADGFYANIGPSQSINSCLFINPGTNDNEFTGIGTKQPGMNVLWISNINVVAQNAVKFCLYILRDANGAGGPQYIRKLWSYTSFQQPATFSPPPLPAM